MKASPLVLPNWNDYPASAVEYLGWYSGRTLLICLPVFLTVVIYTAVVITEIALKKDWLGAKPLKLETTVTKTNLKYQDPTTGTANPANPAGATNPAGGAEFHPNLAVQNPAPGDANALAVPPPPVISGPPVVEKEETLEPYLWEELLVYMAFHVVGLVFCIQPAKTDSPQNIVGVVLAWIHMVVISAYAACSILKFAPGKTYVPFALLLIDWIVIINGLA